MVSAAPAQESSPLRPLSWLSKQNVLRHRQGISVQLIPKASEELPRWYADVNYYF